MNYYTEEAIIAIVWLKYNILKYYQCVTCCVLISDLTVPSIGPCKWKNGNVHKISIVCCSILCYSMLCYATMLSYAMFTVIILALKDLLISKIIM